jgi:hypothetical protein
LVAGDEIGHPAVAASGGASYGGIEWRATTLVSTIARVGRSFLEHPSLRVERHDNGVSPRL